MNELTPLLASSDDELERLLLGSVADDEPGPDALPKAAVALGLGAAMVTSVAGSAAGAATGGALAKHAGITLLSILKWLSAGVGAGLVVSSSVHFALRAGTSAPPVPSNVTQQTLAPAEPPRAPALAPLAAPESPPPSPITAEQPAAPVPVRSVPAPLDTAEPAPAPALPGPSSASFEPLASSHAAFPAPPSASTLAEETRALDRVRSELEARRPSAALAELAHYRKQWPKGALRAEATVLRVEALLGAGDRAAAEREAEALIRIAPQSRHAVRVRELLAR
jgi:hypothetical protein